MTGTSRRPAIDPRFGERLKQLREARGLSLQALASRSFYSKSYVGMLEQRQRPPTARVAARLDAALQAHGELEAMLPAVPPGDPVMRKEVMTMPRNRATQLAQEIAAHLLKEDAFAEAVAEKVAERVDFELAPDTLRGWHKEWIFPAWSGYCFDGDHSACDGSAHPSEKGCHCPHHSGEPIPEWGYRLQIDDRGRLYAEPRTEPRPGFRKREPEA